jgi:isoleucyl-tRNA synthetase
VAVSKFRERALECIEHEIEWVPSWGKERITNMVRDRSDWCISRQRIWGVPIPAFYCKDCGEVLLTADRIKLVAAHIRERGSNYWWEASPEELLGKLAVCEKCGGKNLARENDILDVWFDSGCSYRSVLENPAVWPELSFPASMYLEGSDQHRGWFQSSLLTSVATRDKPPYKAVLTHGFTVDERGRKMSKSLGNAIFPQEVVEKYGADILRLWVASTDYRNDISISQTIISNLAESYRRIRNTARFLLANLTGFDPGSDTVPQGKMTEVDQYVLLKLANLVDSVTSSFDAYEFHLPMTKIHQFCDNELSAFYIDISKETLYADRLDCHARMCARTVMWKVLSALTSMIAPILCFTAEEIWAEMRKMNVVLPASVHWSDWPKASRHGLNRDVEARWDRVIEVRGAILRALESARSQGVIGHALDAEVWALLGSEYAELDTLISDSDWEAVAIVSSFQKTANMLKADVLYEGALTGVTVGVSKNKHEKCPRCWKHRPEVAEKGICDRCADALAHMGK